MNNICEKHKLPITHMCNYIDCKKQRLICNKCNNSHKQHSENIILLEDMTNNSEMDLQNMISIYNGQNVTYQEHKQALHSLNKFASDSLESSFVNNNFANLSLKQEEQVLKKNYFQDDQSYSLVNNQNIEEAQTHFVQDQLVKENNFQEGISNKMAKSDTFVLNEQNINQINNQCFKTQESTLLGCLQQDHGIIDISNLNAVCKQEIQNPYNPDHNLSQEDKFNNDIQQNPQIFSPEIQNNLETNSKQNQGNSIKQHVFLPLQFPFTSSQIPSCKMEEENTQVNQQSNMNVNKSQYIDKIGESHNKKNKESNLQKGGILNNKKQIKSSHENEFLYEIMNQNDNIQKVCLFLRNMNDLKTSLCAKIDRIKHTFLSSIQMKEEDFSYSSLLDSFTANKNLIEERLKNYFNKFKLLNKFFEKNDIIYNPSTATQSKYLKIEQEIDLILSYSIQKLEPELQNEKIEQQKVDLSDRNSEYAELFQYYNNFPVKIEGIKDKIHFQQAYQIEFDGVSKGNPGRSSAGFLIRDIINDKSILEYSIEVGNKTIYQAQYLALVYGLHVCNQLKIKQLRIQSDSEVIIKHMLGLYQVRSTLLKEYYNLAKLLDQSFYSKEYVLVKKELNSSANTVAVQALI